VTGFFSTMLFRATSPLLILMLAAASPAMAQLRQLETDPGVGTTFDRGLGPLGATPDQQRQYTDCMRLARNEPLKAAPVAEKWIGQAGGMGARHCMAVAMFESGRFVPAATQFEAIARDLGAERPGLRAELYAQAGQGWFEANLAENAAAAQSRAIDLKADDADLWIDRSLSFAAMKAWPRCISDLDRALELRPKSIDILVLRAAAWRNAGNPARALEDAQFALRLAPEHSEALLERGFAYLALAKQTEAGADFKKVVDLVPPGSDAARRAEAGLRGDQPGVAAPLPAANDARKR
jgi:tetratricopeptide (TPR) repeat protein